MIVYALIVSYPRWFRSFPQPSDLYLLAGIELLVVDAPLLALLAGSALGWWLP